jgi:hypothetical protein
MNLSKAAQRLLGLIFLVFGLNGFLHFITPPPMTPPGMKFIGDLIATGYMLPLWKGTEVACGALLLADIFGPLALVVIAPVIVNIVGFHLFLDPGNAFIGITLVALALLSAWRHREVYKPLLKPGH